MQHAKLQGVSLRGIARELGIARNNARRYASGSPLKLNSSDCAPNCGTYSRSGD